MLSASAAMATERSSPTSVAMAFRVCVGFGRFCYVGIRVVGRRFPREFQYSASVAQADTYVICFWCVGFGPAADWKRALEYCQRWDGPLPIARQDQLTQCEASGEKRIQVT